MQKINITDVKGNKQQIEWNSLYNCDCMLAMKEIPDKYFDLAIDIIKYV